MFLGCLHEFEQVVVMFCSVFAIHTDVIMYGNNAREPIGDLVHLHLKDILLHLLNQKACRGTNSIPYVY